MSAQRFIAGFAVAMVQSGRTFESQTQTQSGMPPQPGGRLMAAQRFIAGYAVRKMAGPAGRLKSFRTLS